MLSSTDPGPARVSPPPADRPASRSGARLRPRPAPAPAPQPLWQLGVPAVAALLLTHPLLWSATPIPLWSPALGIAFALILWIGPSRAAALLGVAAGLLLLHAVALPAGQGMRVALAALESLL